MSGSPGLAERRTRAMGSAVHVVVVGEGDRAAVLADRAVAHVAALEARWSRFRDDSELSRINAADGAPCLVSDDTAVLVGSLRDAWVATAGRFDPTVSVARLGYTTSFETLGSTLPGPPIGGDPSAGARGAGRDVAAPGCADVEVDRRLGLVRVPAGVALDPGGLGKGLAADLVVGETMRAGAAGVLVNIGGDVAVAGTPLGGGPWALSIEHPDPGVSAPGAPEVGRVVLAAGGVATSTSARRRWRDSTGAAVHHLLDPATGRSAACERRQVTAVAASARDAEVAAKCVFLDGVLPASAEAALVVAASGAVTTLGAAADARFWIAAPIGGGSR